VFGAKLARRIVFPLLLLIAVLFVLLGFAAVRIADARVTDELEAEADRVAATLVEMPAPRPEVLRAMAALVGSELILDGVATRRGIVRKDYRVLDRKVGPRSLEVWVPMERVAQRRRDVLVPIAVAGAVGLLVALALGLLVTRTIVRPVKQLADAVRGASDDPGQGGPGEIGELQDAYVAMVGALRDGEEKLRESERFAALGRLAGGIAHELRNPLTAIRMAVETSTMGDEASRLEARDVALAEIDRLDRTLRELLDFVRPKERVLHPVDLADLGRDVAVLLAPQCEHLNVKLELDVDRGGVVQGDRDRLKQALLNLVLNGAQAQPEGGVVRLRAEGARVEVEDEGPGIAPDVQKTLYQPFVTTKAAGIGLGLAVVAQVAGEHGAALDFRTGNSGTTFILQFDT